MEKEGCFQATVSYGDINLKNGDFNILVLSCKYVIEFCQFCNNLISVVFIQIGEF